MTSVKRDSNIELLRILAAMAVVVLHYNFHAGNGVLDTLLVQRGHNLNITILNCFEVFCNCAVNVFLLITGFYHSSSNRVKLFKPLSLVVQVVIFQELITIIKLLMKGIQGGVEEILLALIPHNWYVMLYLPIIFLSPYMYRFISDLSRKSFDILLVMLIILFSVQPFLCDIINTVSKKH